MRYICAIMYNFAPRPYFGQRSSNSRISAYSNIVTLLSLQPESYSYTHRKVSDVSPSKRPLGRVVNIFARIYLHEMVGSSGRRSGASALATARWLIYRSWSRSGHHVAGHTANRYKRSRNSSIDCTTWINNVTNVVAVASTCAGNVMYRYHDHNIKFLFFE